MAGTIASLIDANQPTAVTFQGPGWDKSKGYAGNVVRWAGTESGHTPSTDMWSTVDDAKAGPGAADPFGQPHPLWSIGLSPFLCALWSWGGHSCAPHLTTNIAAHPKLSLLQSPPPRPLAVETGF